MTVLNREALSTSDQDLFSVGESGGSAHASQTGRRPAAGRARKTYQAPCRNYNCSSARPPVMPRAACRA